MAYDSNQLAQEINLMYRNKEMAFQNFHKICGAIEVLESMQKNILEKEAAVKKVADENGEPETIPEESKVD